MIEALSETNLGFLPEKIKHGAEIFYFANQLTCVVEDLAEVVRLLKELERKVKLSRKIRNHSSPTLVEKRRKAKSPTKTWEEEG
jgi:hypothetical protein